MHPKEKSTPSWVQQMTQGCWYRISGNQPDLNLPATPVGTRYLADNDPAADPRLNPANSSKERVRRLLGRSPRSPWRGKMGFSASPKHGTAQCSHHASIRWSDGSVCRRPQRLLWF